MDYIIDPAVFYWINILGILQTCMAIFGSLLIVAGIVLLLARWHFDKDIYDKHYDSAKGEYVDVLNKKAADKCNLLVKWAKVCIPLGIVIIITSIFIPGKVTSIEMLVARTATFDNLNLTVDGIKDLIDYIVNAISSAV